MNNWEMPETLRRQVAEESVQGVLVRAFDSSFEQVIVSPWIEAEVAV